MAQQCEKPEIMPRTHERQRQKERKGSTRKLHSLGHRLPTRQVPTPGLLDVSLPPPFISLKALLTGVLFT